MRATFHDPELQAALDRDGYATLPFLAADEVASLRNAYEELGPAPGDPHKACHSTFHSSDRTYKAKVDAILSAALRPHLERVFDRQRSLPSNFIAKWPSATSGFGLHQDLSLVDESLHRSVEVWIALDDTDHLNGQLWMVPGSHRWLEGNIRGINGFDFAFNAVARRIMDRHARPVPVRAGEAIVFDHATLHFSLPNRSDAPRLVAIADLIPAEAQHLHYFGNEAGGIDVYEIDDAFWTGNNPFTLWRPPPEAQRIASIPRSNRTLDDDGLDDLLRAGLAIESSSSPGGAPNAAKPWCHRCGRSDFDAHPPDRWVGNVTMLCGDCIEAEIMGAVSADHVVPR